MNDWNKIWRHFDRMQSIMADKTTRSEFFAQSEEERMEFYLWLQRQCGQYACYI